MKGVAKRATLFLLGLLGLPAVAMALSFQGLGAPPGNVSLPMISGVTQSYFIGNLVYTIASWMFWGLIVLSIIMGLVAAYRYLTSAGEPDKISKANKTLLYAAVAVIVALLAYAIPFIVTQIFTGTSLQNPFP